MYRDRIVVEQQFGHWSAWLMSNRRLHSVGLRRRKRSTGWRASRGRSSTTSRHTDGIRFNVTTRRPVEVHGAVWLPPKVGRVVRCRSTRPLAHDMPGGGRSTDVTTCAPVATWFLAVFRQS